MRAVKNDDTEYFELLAALNCKTCRLIDTISINNRKVVSLRHDVDHDLDKALRFAEAESKRDVLSTYFVLPSAPYFDYSPEFYNKLLHMQSMGHEIGLHNNALTLYFQKTPYWLEDSVIGPLNKLRDAGINIYGTSSHGDKLAYKHNYRNYELWTQCPEDWRINNDVRHITVDIHSEPWSLMYEAYFLRRDVYLTDSGYRWAGSVLHVPPFEHWENALSRQQTVDGFNSIEGNYIMQLLTHPIWWEPDASVSTGT